MSTLRIENSIPLGFLRPEQVDIRIRRTHGAVILDVHDLSTGDSVLCLHITGPDLARLRRLCGSGDARGEGA